MRVPPVMVVPNLVASNAGHVLFYGVVSAQTEKVAEFFLEREVAEAKIDEVREDEPALADRAAPSRMRSDR